MRLPAVWGATDAEVATPTPADALVDEPRARWVRAASSSAPPAALWRWVCQLTVAPYSYDLVDNLGRRSPRSLTPGAERVVAGQPLLTLFVVDAVRPGEHLTIRRRRPGGRLVGEFAVTYAVRATPSGSRLVATVVVGGGDGRVARAVRTALAWGDLVMMRKQLTTLALRAGACPIGVLPCSRAGARERTHEAVGQTGAVSAPSSPARRLRAPVVLPCDGSSTVLRDAVVDVDDQGRLGYVGPAGSAPASDAVEQRVTGLLMPGLVNTHAHTPLALLRGMGGDLPLMRWLTEVVWPAEARLEGSDVRLGMLAGGLEMVRGGVTTSTEMYFWADEVVDAVLEIGSRVVMTPGIITAPGMERLGTWEQMRDAISAWIDADGLRFGPGGRVELGYGAHSAYTLSTDAVATSAAAARERGALFHIHVAEAVGEDDAVRAEFGSVPAMLETTGSLGGRVLAAHAIQLSAQDLEILARHDVAVAHCPGSNAKLAAGVAPIAELLTAGIRIGLGTDSPASNDDLDLWEEQRLASLFARQQGADATALTAADVLDLATRGGADALGRDDLGRLRPGAWADVVHVDLDDAAFVDPDDDAQLVSNLVWASGARGVRDVWVAGEPVLADRAPVRVDPVEIVAGVRRIGRRIKG